MQIKHAARTQTPRRSALVRRTSRAVLTAALASAAVCAAAAPASAQSNDLQICSGDIPFATCTPVPVVADVYTTVCSTGISVDNAALSLCYPHRLGNIIVGSPLARVFIRTRS